MEEEMNGDEERGWDKLDEAARTLKVQVGL